MEHFNENMKNVKKIINKLQPAVSHCWSTFVLPESSHGLRFFLFVLFSCDRKNKNRLLKLRRKSCPLKLN